MSTRAVPVASRDGVVELAVVDVGDGPATVLVHGFPELAFSWRRQIPALAGAGLRVVAYDQRGYGGSSKPDETARYDLRHLVADLVGLLDALGIDRAHLVGHDWGSIVVWATAVLHPERVDRLVSLNVPYRGWMCGFPTIDFIREHLADRFDYVLAFQEEGVVEAAFEADPDGWLRRLYERVAGSPSFLAPDEFAVYRDAFVAGGLRGPVAYYRNIDENAAFAASYADAAITAPTLMITVDADPVLPASLAEGMDRWVPDLVVSHVPGSGHWTQQERPDHVNELLIDFLTIRPRG